MTDYVKQQFDHLKLKYRQFITSIKGKIKKNKLFFNRNVLDCIYVRMLYSNTPLKIDGIKKKDTEDICLFDQVMLNYLIPWWRPSGIYVAAILIFKAYTILDLIYKTLSSVYIIFIYFSLL